MVGEKQASQKKSHDDKSKLREDFEVIIRNLRPGPKYVPGVIVQRMAPYSCSVEVKDGIVWKRHGHKLGETTHEREYVPEVDQGLAEEDEDIYLPFSNSRNVQDQNSVSEMSTTSTSITFKTSP